MNRPLSTWCLLSASLLLTAISSSAGEKLPDKAIARFGTTMFRPNGRVFGMAQYANSSKIVVGTKVEIVVWDILKGERSAFVPTPFDLAPEAAPPMRRKLKGKDALAVSSDGSRIALHRRGNLLLYDADLKTPPIALASNQEINLEFLTFGSGNSAVYCMDSAGALHVRRVSEPRWRLLADASPGSRWHWLTTASITGQVSEAGLFRMIDHFKKDKITEWQGPACLQAAISRDSKSIVFGIISKSKDRALELWDVDSGKRKNSFPVELPFLGIALSSDGTKVAAVSQHPAKMEVWETRTGKRLKSMNLDGFAPASAMFLPGDRELLVIGQSGAMTVWKLNAGQHLYPDMGPYDAISSLHFAGNDRLLFRSFDGEVYHADLPGRTLTHLKGSRGRAQGLAISKDGKIGYANDPTLGSVIRTFKTDTGAEVAATAKIENMNFRFLSLSPDGKQLAFVTDGNKSVQLLEAISGKATHDIAFDNRSSVRSLSFAGEKLLVASVVGGNGGLFVFDTEHGKLVRQIEAKYQTGAGFFAVIESGRRLVAPVFDFRARRKEPTLMFWGIDTGKIVDRFELSAVQYTSIAAAQDGKLVLLGTATGDIEIWNVAQQKLHATYTGGHRGAVECLAVSPDGRTFASGGADTTVMLWKMPAP